MLVAATTKQTSAGRHRRDSHAVTLPQPPSDTEKADYADNGIGLITGSSLISFGAILFSQARFVLIALPLLYLSPLIAFTLAYYVISLFVNLGTRGFDMDSHRALVQSWRPTSYPALDIFLPICGEPLEILHNTWTQVFELIQCYPGTATAYVLDDGGSDDAQAMAADFGFTYLSRPDRGFMKKAGNLRHGFFASSGDFILILDADFAPRADLPLEMLPYMMADPSLGIIQSPQFFRVTQQQSWVERGAGAVQELFYRLVQVSRDRHGGAICVGSCAIYRREALRSNGGTTLIEHSEDVHTGFDLRRAGWGLRYIPVPLATGLCPSDPDSFLSQQYRWCAGSMSLLASRKFWQTKMRWRTRCCYLSGFCYYVHTAAFTFATPLIPLVMVTALADRVRLVNYVFIIPSIAYNYVVFPAWHRCRYGPSAFMAKLLYGWAHVFALWDICRGRRIAWQPTGGSAQRSRTRRIWIGVAVWNGTTGIAWVAISVLRSIQYESFNFVIIVCSGLFTCVVTFMALRSRSSASPRVAGGS
jgi:GT2 family glycosyltransferase